MALRGGAFWVGEAIKQEWSGRGFKEHKGSEHHPLPLYTCVKSQR